MRVGDLVRWSEVWISGCKAGTAKHTGEFSQYAQDQYKDQIGVLSHRSEELDRCWIVIWNDGNTDEVHVEYLEVICK